MQVLDEAPPSEPVFRAAIRGCVDKEEVDVVHDQAARDCDCVGMPCADSLERIAYARQRALKKSLQAVRVLAKLSAHDHVKPTIAMYALCLH